MTEATWAGDWRERVRQRILALGFEAPRDYGVARPRATFAELANELGPDVAPVQVESVLYEESLLGGYLLENARAALVRELLEIVPRDLKRGHALSFARSHAFAAWSSSMHEELAEAASRAWGRLVPGLSETWVPDGPEDPIVVAAFAGHEDEWTGRNVLTGPVPSPLDGAAEQSVQADEVP
jgi:hypothetical protein